MPMESPVGADKLMYRSRLYLNEFISQNLADQFQIKTSLSKLAEIKKQSRQSMSRESSKKPKVFSRSKAQETLLKLLSRKDQEDRRWLKVALKDAFTLLAGYAERQAKLQTVLSKAYQRHIEKTFDKIKETSWYREERKLALESLIVKRVSRESLDEWGRQTRKFKAARKMIALNFERGDRLKKQAALRKWK